MREGMSVEGKCGEGRIVEERCGEGRSVQEVCGEGRIVEEMWSKERVWRRYTMLSRKECAWRQGVEKEKV